MKMSPVREDVTSATPRPALPAMRRYWSEADLTKVGFSTAEAERIAPVLPSVTVRAFRHAMGHAWYLYDDSGPAAVVLYATYRLPRDVARRLARSGCDLVELVGIIDTFVETLFEDGVVPYWPTSDTDVLLEWTEDQRIASDRVVAYLRAGVDREEAAAFEADETARPSTAQLDVLAALRCPALTGANRR
ncbi:hypothetical protein [Nocardioides sp. WS12]|uniref:hypothetical protein n=1 Tax=Nocardioides sp. WS12 TaxID=2486272 RepID=UPI0015FC5C5A|nr:hypothetical protein [Nocardioides sp. WS12]